MPLIGNMLWRIGRLLDIERQMAWTQRAGFDGVGLHAAAGTPGQWRGVEPATCPPEERARLRQKLAGFAFVEIHAPFAIAMRVENLSASVAALAPVLDFAHDLGARVVTVHACPAEAEARAWLPAMQEVNARAAEAQTTVALEITDGFGAVTSWGLPQVGVNLDVGHMLLPVYGAPLTRYGGFGPLIGLIGPKLVHLHLHDVRDAVDHIEIGTGEVAFGDIIDGLAAIDYAGTATLEMNPDRVSPAGIRRSLETLRTHLAGGRPAR
ncbi:MAG: sugar phosphate isomerase/epimerase [Armatimonadetes bacterium]|nr:sugar phosphate isomerase/epimerase [Armatimonadota bacterium]